KVFFNPPDVGFGEIKDYCCEPRLFHYLSMIPVLFRFFCVYAMKLLQPSFCAFKVHQAKRGAGAAAATPDQVSKLLEDPEIPLTGLDGGMKCLGYGWQIPI